MLDVLYIRIGIIFKEDHSLQCCTEAQRCKYSNDLARIRRVKRQLSEVELLSENQRAKLSNNYIYLLITHRDLLIEDAVRLSEDDFARLSNSTIYLLITYKGLSLENALRLSMKQCAKLINNNAYGLMVRRNLSVEKILALSDREIAEL